MADNRTGLSPADIAESFRDMCGDGSVEWVYTPTQTWLLLDAADMLDENAEPEENLTQVTENGERAQRAIDALNDENAKLRELCRSMYHELMKRPLPPEWITEYGSDVLEYYGIEVDW